MTKKSLELNLKKRVKNLEAKFNEFVFEFNAMQTDLHKAFDMVKKDRNAMKERLTTIENMLLIGDFKAKLAKGDSLRRRP